MMVIGYIIPPKTLPLNCLYPDKTIAAISEEIRSLNEQHTFGFWCGLSGAPPQLGEKMYALVVKRDFGTLKRWSQSLNPEYAAFGYIGLKWLTHKNKVMRRAHHSVFQQVTERNPQLYSCSGCFFNRHARFKEHGAFRSWKKYYKGVKSAGWLQAYPNEPKY